jgi:energy-coupling factor transporter ATP-binding protein EcfA2
MLPDMMLLFGDLHAHNFPQCSETVQGGLNSRCIDAVKVLREILWYALRYNLHTVFMGDLFHDRSAVPIEVWNHIYRVFQEYADKLEMTMLLGNHDMCLRTPGENSIEGFRELGIQVIDRPERIEIGRANVHAIPYMTNGQELKRALHDASDADLALMHQGIKGVVSRSGFVLQGEVLRKSDLPTGLKIYSGHIHEVQRLTKDFIYVGSCMQHDWGDAGIPKGFMIVDERTAKLKKYVRTRTPPRFMNVPLGRKLSSKLCENNFVRFLATTDRERRIAEKKAVKAKELGAQFVAAPVPTDTAVTTGVATKTGEALSVARMIDAFVDENVLNEKRAAKLKALGREFLQTSKGAARTGSRITNLLQVDIGDWLSWERAQLWLKRAGLTFLHGDNGVGKTALFDAIEWILFKRISRPNVSVQKYIRRGAKSAFGRLVFQTNTGDIYHVYRYRNDPKWGNGLRIIKNKREITPPVPAEAERRLEQIVGCSRAAFNNSILFSQDSEFYFSAFSDATQKKVLRELLDLSVLVQCRSAAKDKRDAESAKLIELDAKSEQMDSEIEHLHESLEEGKQQTAALKRKYKRQRVALQEKLNDALADKDDADGHLVVAKNKLASLRAKRAKLKNERRELQNVVRGRTGDCPVCHAPVRCPDCNHPLRDEQRIQEGERKQRRVIAALAQCDSDYDVCDGAVEKAGEHARRVGARVRSCQDELARVPKVLARPSRDDSRRLRTLGEARSRLESERRRVQARYRRYEFWCEGFSQRGVELFALKHVLPMLTENTNHYLKRLFAGTSLEFKLNDKGSIEVVIDTGNLAYDVGGLSKGQKRRYDISVGLALQDTMASFTGARSNLLVMDEVFENLDPKGVEEVVQLLKDIKPTRPSIYVVSHRAELRNSFGRSREVRLNGGISQFTD